MLQLASLLLLVFLLPQSCRPSRFEAFDHAVALHQQETEASQDAALKVYHQFAFGEEETAAGDANGAALLTQFRALALHNMAMIEYSRKRYAVGTAYFDAAAAVDPLASVIYLSSGMMYRTWGTAIREGRYKWRDFVEERAAFEEEQRGASVRLSLRAPGNGAVGGEGRGGSDSAEISLSFERCYGTSAALFRKLLLLEPKSIKGLSSLASMLHYDMADNIQLNEGDPHAADANLVVPTYRHYHVDQGPKGRSAYGKGAFETYQDVLSEATSRYGAVLSSMQEQRSKVLEARKGTDARKRRKEEALLAAGVALTKQEEATEAGRPVQAKRSSIRAVDARVSAAPAWPSAHARSCEARHHSLAEDNRHRASLP